MIIVIRRLRVKVGKIAEFMAAMQKLKADMKAKEPKMISCDIYRIQERPLSFYIISQFPDEASSKNASSALTPPVAASLNAVVERSITRHLVPMS